MANHARGEADLVIGGKTYKVPAYSIAVLEAVSEAVGTDGLQALCARLDKMDPRDMVPITQAVLKGGGHEAPVEDIRAMPWTEYVKQVLPLIIEFSKPGDAEARPQKRQAKSA